MMKVQGDVTLRLYVPSMDVPAIDISRNLVCDS